MEPSMFLVAAREVMKQKGLVPRDLIKMGARSRNRIYDWLGGRAEMKESGLADLMKGLGIGLVVGEEVQALEKSKAAVEQGMKMLGEIGTVKVVDDLLKQRKRRNRRRFDAAKRIAAKDDAWKEIIRQQEKFIGKRKARRKPRKPRKPVKRKSAKRTRAKRR